MKPISSRQRIERLRLWAFIAKNKDRIIEGILKTWPVRDERKLIARTRTIDAFERQLKFQTFTMKMIAYVLPFCKFTCVVCGKENVPYRVSIEGYCSEHRMAGGSRLLRRGLRTESKQTEVRDEKNYRDSVDKTRYSSRGTFKAKR